MPQRLMLGDGERIARIHRLEKEFGRIHVVSRAGRLEDLSLLMKELHGALQPGGHSSAEPFTIIDRRSEHGLNDWYKIVTKRSRSCSRLLNTTGGCIVTITHDYEDRPSSMISIRSGVPPLKPFLLFAAIVFFAIGCDRQTANLPDQATSPATISQTPAKPIPADDAEAVAVVEAVTDQIRRGGQGEIIGLDFRDTEVTDETLVAVGKLSQLQQLDLRDGSISDAGLAHLTELKQLKALRLSGKSGDTNVTDDGMKFVAQLPNLKLLSLDSLWVSEIGLSELRGMANLQELYMAETTIADEAIEIMASMPKLKKLRLAKTQIGAPAIAAMPQLEKLEELDLSECAQLSDEAMGPLAEMKSLKKLNLWRVNLTDQGIQPIGKLSNLESLNLDNTRLTDAGLPAIGGLKKLTFLHLGSTSISNAGLDELKELKNLKNLIVTRTAVTQEGVDALQTSLPQTEIQLVHADDQ